MLAPRVYCDPSEYFYNDDLAQKTINAHIYINQREKIMLMIKAVVIKRRCFMRIHGLMC